MSGQPKGGSGGNTEPKGGGAGNKPKEKAPAKGYGQNFGKKGPGRKPGGDTKGKGGKHTRT